MTNGTLIQYFHWYLPEDFLWKQVQEEAKHLGDMGITAIWLPPAYKSQAGGMSVGYDPYDLYDLGEFDQKGSVRTKYGNKDEYLQAVEALKNAGVQLIVDVVLNHKAGGDEVEQVMAVKVADENRNQVISEPKEIGAFTKFLFQGRDKTYSEFIWDFQCFTGVDFDKNTGDMGVFSFKSEYGDGWEQVVGFEKGNYDYLMYCDIEFRNPAVRQELLDWAKWYHSLVDFHGVRLDAVKHMSPGFFNEWLGKLREATGKEIFAVGEYWSSDLQNLLLPFMHATEGNMHLFDAPLQANFHRASKMGNNFDMQDIFVNTLVSLHPDKAVTIVDNHDTQPMQSLEAPVEEWFKPMAYALILLRQEGYPCLFYPDVYGCSYKDYGEDGNEYEIFLNKIHELETLVRTRKDNAYGMQRDYFDHANCIGWTREGDDEHSGCAVVLSNGDAGNKPMEIGKRYAGQIFADALQKTDATITIDENGWADFFCEPGSVSVWVLKQ